MSSPGSGPFPAGNFTFRRHHILMGCIELFVVDLALSKDFVIRCDKLMLINLYCAQFEVPCFKIKKIFCVFLAFILLFKSVHQKVLMRVSYVQLGFVFSLALSLARLRQVFKKFHLSTIFSLFGLNQESKVGFIIIWHLNCTFQGGHLNRLFEADQN